MCLSTYVLNIYILGLTQKESKPLERIALSDITYMTSMPDLLAIVCRHKESIIVLIRLRVYVVVLYESINCICNYQSCVFMLHLCK